MFCHVKGKCQQFSVLKKLIYIIFLYGIQPNDTLIMKVIDQIMGKKKKKKKNHEDILFGQWENASTIKFLYCDHPNGTP